MNENDPNLGASRLGGWPFIYHQPIGGGPKSVRCRGGGVCQRKLTREEQRQREGAKKKIDQRWHEQQTTLLFHRAEGRYDRRVHHEGKGRKRSEPEKIKSGFDR